MKIVWTILIGMIIFQSLFVTLGTLDAFNLEPDQDERLIGLENITTNTTGLDIKKPGNLWGSITGGMGTLLLGIGTAAAVVLLITVSKNYVAAALVIYIGFVSWLYMQTAGIFMRMNDIGGGSLIGVAFIGLFGVVLAILVVKSIIEMLAPGGVD